MMASPRIFLILLVPLLLHGAPTLPDKNQPGNLPSGSQSLPSLRDTLALHDVQLLPLSQSVVGQPNRPPLPSQSTSDRVVPTTELANNACTIPQGSKYRPYPYTEPFRMLPVKRVRNTFKDRVVFSPHGDIIFVKKGSSIMMGQLQLPSASSGEIGIYIVDKTDELARTTCALQENTRYYSTRAGQLPPLSSKITTARSDWVARTPKNDFVFLPKGTIIISVKIDDMSLPGPGTRIRLIDGKKLPPEGHWTIWTWTRIHRGDFDIQRT